MIEVYQKLIEGEAIEPPSKTQAQAPIKSPRKKTPVLPPPTGKSLKIINPIAFENLKIRFGDEFPNVLEDLRRKRAYLMKFGYAKEYDPRSSNIPQFKNVYLLRRSELVNVTQVLNRTLKRLKPGMIKSLWKELIERIYGETYASGKTFNEYAKMHDGITYRNLSVLFDKTQEQISHLNPYQYEEIAKEVKKVKERLEDLINNKTSKRFFGSQDDPYVWLKKNEMP
jgi:hypothetical protein